MTEGKPGTEQWCTLSLFPYYPYPLASESLETDPKRYLEAHGVTDMGFVDTEQAANAGWKQPT